MSLFIPLSRSMADILVRTSAGLTTKLKFPEWILQMSVPLPYSHNYVTLQRNKKQDNKLFEFREHVRAFLLLVNCP